MRGIKEWQHYVTAARAVGQRLPDEQYYELRYEALVKAPESTLRGLLSYLEEQANIYASRIGAWRHELPLKIVFYFWSGRLLKELGYQ